MSSEFSTPVIAKPSRKMTSTRRRLPSSGYQSAESNCSLNVSPTPVATIEKAYGRRSEDEFVSSHFEKSVPFRAMRPQGVRNTINLYSSEKWTHHEQMRDFETLKTKLNGVKDQLENFNLNDWHRHTRTTNPADLVMRRLRSEMKVEFLTQAWCKFYELVSEFNLVPKEARNSRRFYSIHLTDLNRAAGLEVV